MNENKKKTIRAVFLVSGKGGLGINMGILIFELVFGENGGEIKSSRRRLCKCFSVNGNQI